MLAANILPAIERSTLPYARSHWISAFKHTSSGL